jgi:hypothetical protein
MKNRRSARARTLPLMFAPLLLGTIVAPAGRPVRTVDSERVRGARLSRGRTVNRAK